MQICGLILRFIIKNIIKSTNSLFFALNTIKGMNTKNLVQLLGFSGNNSRRWIENCCGESNFVVGGG